jgi:hypothetical protein
MVLEDTKSWYLQQEYKPESIVTPDGNRNWTREFLCNVCSLEIDVVDSETYPEFIPMYY